MAPGAVLGAAGAMMATQSKRQMRRNVRKVMKGAENAVMQLALALGSHHGTGSPKDCTGGQMCIRDRSLCAASPE